MTTWQCIRGCGACCYLDPAQRPELEDYLSPQELALYLSMVGEDGWCIHFDRSSRLCQIYEQRPSFCRARPDTFERLYGIERADFDEFAIECCHEHIDSIYGESSNEKLRYTREVGSPPPLEGDNGDETVS